MTTVPKKFRILSEDGPSFVVEKPAGLPTQAPPGIESLESLIKGYFKVRDSKPGKVYLGVPHRLDRPVSGVMVFAKHVRAARRLSEQFERREVRKIYWACVEGNLESDSGVWEDMIRKIPDRAHAEVAPDHPQSRKAILRYSTLGRTTHGSWLQIELETGRTHQIRVQLASRGHPVIGDFQYGASIPFGTQFEDERLRGIALHGRSLEFEHPMTRERQKHTANLPDPWQSLQLQEADGVIFDGSKEPGPVEPSPAEPSQHDR